MVSINKKEISQYDLVCISVIWINNNNNSNNLNTCFK